MTAVLHDLSLPASVDRLGDVFALMERAAVAAGFPDARRADLALVVEEAYVNVCRHAYGGRDDGLVGIRIEADSGELTVEMRDSGPAFDPLAAPAPNLTASLDERRPGGLGIELMRRLTDELRYERKDGENRLRLVFRW